VRRYPETTSEVIAWLVRLGLMVDEKQIANDTTDRFLPPRLVGQAPTGRGRTGLWEPWMVCRAERLYRLRRRKGENGLPMVYGDTLRILLFVRDGWGWSPDIRDRGLEGYEKGIKATLKPVRRYVRGPADRESVEFALEAHDVGLVPAERYAAGVMAYGEPLEGGSLRGVFKAAQALGLVDLPRDFVKLFESIGLHSALDIATYVGSSIARHQGWFKVAFELANSRDAANGAPMFIGFITRVRTGIHKAALVEGRSFPTNPLTFFGRTQREIESLFREMKAPERVTPAQMLSLFIGIAIVTKYMLDLSERLAMYALNIAQKVFGMKPPTSDNRMAPFAFDVVRRVFGINVFPNTTQNKKRTQDK
jgi:hypothetical protein